MVGLWKDDFLEKMFNNNNTQNIYDLCSADTIMTLGCVDKSDNYEYMLNVIDTI